MYTQHTFILKQLEKVTMLCFLIWLSLINPYWLELPLSRTNFHSPKGVRAIKVRLYSYEHIGGYLRNLETWNCVLKYLLFSPTRAWHCGTKCTPTFHCCMNKKSLQNAYGLSYEIPQGPFPFRLFIRTEIETSKIRIEIITINISFKRLIISI